MTLSVVLSLILGAIGIVLWIEGGPQPRTWGAWRLLVAIVVVAALPILLCWLFCYTVPAPIPVGIPTRVGRLSVTIRFEGHDYVTLLDQWQSPPTVDAVEATLRRGLGRTVQAVGRVEIGARGRPLPVGRRPGRS